MAQRIVVIGGGAAGIGAAGAAKAVDAAADIHVYTEFEDVGYSPCGIPYVHGKEIPDFEQLFLATKEAYAGQGIDIHYETRATGFEPGGRWTSWTPSSPRGGPAPSSSTPGPSTGAGRRLFDHAGDWGGTPR